MKLRLGPAGNVEKDILSSIKSLVDLKLECQEVEFVRGVRMGLDLAKEVGKLAKKLGIKLSVHAPYYINLCSKEKEKIEASKIRILDSCERGHYLGAKHIVFHAGYYLDHGEKETFDIIKKEIINMQKVIKKNKWNVLLCPETTGKRTQFGTLDELLRLMKETKCGICVDFSHIYARDNGKIDYKKVFDKLVKAKIKELHCHFSGIEFTEKGERKHLVMEERLVVPLLKELKKRDFEEVTIISESPITFRDSLLMKKVWERLS